MRGASLGAIVLTAMAVIAPTAVNAAETPTASSPAASLKNEGTYYQLSPSRLLDTRNGTGAPQQALGPNSTLSLQVTGRGGVPSAGVSAVVLNVTVVVPTQASLLTVYPSGVAKPEASSLNFAAGWIGANSVTVAVGTDGKVNIYNASGSVSVVADVFGFYALDDSMVSQLGPGSLFQESVSGRIFDSRDGGGPPLLDNQYVLVGANYGLDINIHIKALVVNVTAVGPTGGGYLTAWSGTGAPPNTSTLNFTAGTIVPNMAVVPTTSCSLCEESTPYIGVYTPKQTHVLIDVLGFFADDGLSDGLLFTAMTPTRIADSRTHFGLPDVLGPNTTGTITTPASIATKGTYALATNVTAVGPTQSTFLTVWPDGFTNYPRPEASNLNPSVGQTVPNAVYTSIGPANAFNVYNSLGNCHVLVDVVGSFHVPDTTSLAGSKVAPGTKNKLSDHQPAATRKTLG